METSKGPSSHYRPLEGKTALVTGASRGIGAGIARNLASKGAKLILNYTSSTSTQICNDLASKLTEAYGVQHIVVQADMGSLSGPDFIIRKAASKIPNFRLDIIVNNAGILTVGKIADCDMEDFDRVYSVNVRGPLLLMMAALPYLPHDRSGRVVNVSSISATSGLLGQSVYGGSKASLDAMTRTWARELAGRATVNSINPGPVITDMWQTTDLTQFSITNDLKALVTLAPLGQVRRGVDDEGMVKCAEILGGRPARVDEIAGIVGMLVGNESGWCTGQVICANGGLKMSM
ncbi:putative 3-oxoacyl-(acyl-carrier-protein) reductase 1 [Erysiphe necator]|uniref:Putative 3-oxoacyl-(Acyl-carrier-protein) reductase 1 n=1 Tax=Uncinula necator TaxID=52586 RepID=A0A0B1PC58_UNCNE|nr:putative 3-oxoacyl-(acyl-carrier-protein) reductase 1 [Erysiphe necator]